MKLAAYLEQHGIKLDAFADRIGVANASVVHRYATGKRTPRPNQMAAIVRETGGQVQPNDFFDAAPIEAVAA